jgi:hypothetical protein
MKHIKLFEQFINERLDVKGLSQKVMQDLDTFGQLHPQYLPAEVLNTIEGVLGKYKSLYGGKLTQKIASEIRDELGETGNLANDSYRHIKDVDHIIAGALHESYSEEDINMSHGFFRTVLDAEDVKSEQDAIDLFDEGIMMLKKHYRLTEEEALAVLNSAMGRHAADQIVSGEANTAMLGLEQYYGKKLKSEIAKVQRTMVNENLRSDLKKYIKKNKKEIDQLADQDDWDGIYRMLMNDFEVEDGSEDAEDLKQTFNFVY